MCSMVISLFTKVVYEEIFIFLWIDPFNKHNASLFSVKYIESSGTYIFI